MKFLVKYFSRLWNLSHYVAMSTTYPPSYFPKPGPYTNGMSRRQNLSPSWLRREPADEDDNKYMAKRLRRQDRQNRIYHIVYSRLRLKSPFPMPPAALVVPKERPFKWTISSHHVAEAYQDISIRHQSPWYLLLRCLFLDLPEQTEERNRHTVVARSSSRGFG